MEEGGRRWLLFSGSHRFPSSSVAVLSTGGSFVFPGSPLVRPHFGIIMSHGYLRSGQHNRIDSDKPGTRMYLGEAMRAVRHLSNRKVYDYV
jgi:hypothetical protein